MTPIYNNYSYNPYNLASISGIDGEEDEENLFQCQRTAIIEDLLIRIKETRAAGEDDEPQKILYFFDEFLKKLVADCGYLETEDVLSLLQSAVDVVGNRLQTTDYQRITCFKLLYLVKTYTKLIHSRGSNGNFYVKLDFSFALRLKNIFEPYFLGKNYVIWREVYVETIILNAKKYECTSYELPEFINSLTVLEVVFSSDNSEGASLDLLLPKRNREVAFEFLKRLSCCGISLTFFYEFTKDVFYFGQLSDEEVEVINMYLDYMSLSRTIDILFQMEEKNVLSFAGWNMLVEGLFKKVDRIKSIFFLDVWNLMKFSTIIMNKMTFEGDFLSRVHAVLDKNIRLQLEDKNSINCLSFSVAEVRKINAELGGFLKVLGQVGNDIHRKKLADVLFFVIVTYMRALKEENTLSLVEALAPHIESNPEVDYSLLLMVLELILITEEEKKDINELISRLAKLSLFKNSDLLQLLRHWNSFIDDFMILYRGGDEYNLLEVLSPLLGLSVREIILVLSLEVNEIKSITKCKRRLLEKNVKTVPSDFEMGILSRFFEKKDTKILLDSFLNLRSLYLFSEDFEQRVIRNILKSLVNPVKSKLPVQKLIQFDDDKKEKICRIWEKQLPKEPALDYFFYKDVLKFLVRRDLSFNKCQFAKDNLDLIKAFLKQRFNLLETFNKSIYLNNEPTTIISSKEEIAIVFGEYQDLVKSVVELYGLDRLKSHFFLNWIAGCQTYYLEVRKTAQATAYSMANVSYYLLVKKNLIEMVICAYGFIKNPYEQNQAFRIIRAFNRPLLTNAQPTEAKIVYRKNRLKLSENEFINITKL